MGELIISFFLLLIKAWKYTENFEKHSDANYRVFRNTKWIFEDSLLRQVLVLEKRRKRHVQTVIARMMRYREHLQSFIMELNFLDSERNLKTERCRASLIKAA